MPSRIICFRKNYSKLKTSIVHDMNQSVRIFRVNTALLWLHLHSLARFFTIRLYEAWISLNALSKAKRYDGKKRKQVDMNIYLSHTTYTLRIYSSWTSLYMYIGNASSPVSGLSTFEPARVKTFKMACAPSEDRSAWAPTQSDQSLCCLHVESFCP